MNSSSESSIVVEKNGPGNITVRGGGNEDQPASLANDKLGFRPYVEAIYSYLKNPETKAPFTLSIEGDWGSGKSSFMWQLEESLRADKQRTIRFNAWRHDKVESMWAAFALHFIRELSGQLPLRKRILANLQLRWKRFDIGSGWFPLLKTSLLLVFYVIIGVKFLNYIQSHGISFFKTGDKFDLNSMLPFFGSAGIVVGLFFFLGKIAEVMGNPFKSDLQKYIVAPNYEGNVAFIEEFHCDFQQTVNLMTCDKDKIFVFIDDLDRAEVPKAAELMQGLNMMISNSPRLVFIIGMDREKVAAGVAAKYKDLLPFLNPGQQSLTTAEGLFQARDFGHKFLEKFVQLSFQIPKPSVQAARDFINSLSGAKEEVGNEIAEVRYKPVLTVKDGEDTKQFREVTLLLSDFFEDNPRRLKQFVNAFRLKAHIANSTGLFNETSDPEHKPLTIPQLGKFIALRMIWPQLIDDLLVNPKLLQQISSKRLAPGKSSWLDNTFFMNLLALTPQGDEGTNDAYSMEFLNIWPLIETSPAFSPDKIEEPNSAPSDVESAPAGRVREQGAQSSGNPYVKQEGRSSQADYSSTGHTTTTTTMPPENDASRPSQRSSSREKYYEPPRKK